MEDGAGDATTPLAGVVVANAALAPCSFNVDNGGLSGPGNQNEGATDFNVYHSATGTRRAMVLPVSFPDAPGTESLPTLDGQLFQPVEGGYFSMSYGKLGLQIDVAPGWYRLPQPSTYYQLQPGDGPGRKDEYIAAAILQADPTIDFSQYDSSPHRRGGRRRGPRSRRPAATRAAARGRGRERDPARGPRRQHRPGAHRSGRPPRDGARVRVARSLR